MRLPPALAPPADARTRRRGAGPYLRHSWALAAIVAVSACGGGGGAGDDGDAAAAIDAPTAPAGTWDAPFLIDALPFQAVGDIAASGERRAVRYDCAPAIDEGGAEVVYALDLAAPVLVTIAATGPGTDVDVHVLRAAATGADAAGCAARDDRALVIDLAPGRWWIAVDTIAGGAPGAYTLAIDLPRSAACLTNPIPACQAGDAPDVDGVPVEPPGLGGCPAGMARVAGFCIDRWEAALVAVDAGGARGWSPYRSPGTQRARAVSAPGLVPQGHVSGTQAAAACAEAGKRLCTDTEWLRACQGVPATTYPYGATREPGRCNDARPCHPAVQYFESSDQSVFSMIDHACLNQLPDGLARTGAHERCVTADGVFDLMGNLHEWTADPAGTFRGGFYVDTRINGDGCRYRTTAHDTSHHDYSTGFRCCADPP